MGVPRDVSPFGAQTVTGPGWPNVDEEQLEHAALQYEAWAAKMTGSVVPEQQGRVVKLQSDWTGPSSVAAAGEATAIVGSHQANAALATTIATRLHAMAATVVETKTAVNAAAEEVQQECLAMQAMPVQNKAELIESRIKMGLAQNIATVSANAAGVAATAGVPANVAGSGSPSAGSAEAMQVMTQLAQLAVQLPSQLGGMVTQAPQQLMQPLQSLTSMFGGGGAGKGGWPSPFAAFSNHPLAGGSGAGGGAGLVKAASLPGARGTPARTSVLARLAGTSTASGSPAIGAAGGVVGGLAPVGAGGGMLGQRGPGGATSTAALVAPAPLAHDSGDEVDDEW